MSPPQPYPLESTFVFADLVGGVVDRVVTCCVEEDWILGCLRCQHLCCAGSPQHLPLDLVSVVHEQQCAEREERLVVRVADVRAWPLRVGALEVRFDRAFVFA